MHIKAPGPISRHQRRVELLAILSPLVFSHSDVKTFNPGVNAHMHTTYAVHMHAHTKTCFLRLLSITYYKHTHTQTNTDTHTQAYLRFSD